MPAIAGVVGIAGIVAALVAILLLIAYPQIVRPLIVAGLSQVPLVGGWLVRNADDVSMRAYAEAAKWALVAVSPFTDLLRRFRVAWFLYTDKTTNAIVQLTLAAWGLRYQVIPATVTQMTDYANQVYSWSVQFTTSVYARATAFAQALHDQETAFANQVYSWSVQFTTSVYARATAFAQALHDQAIGFAQALHSQAIQYARDLQAQETQYAQALHAQAIGFAEDAFGRSIEFEQKLYGDATRYAEGLAKVDREYAQRVGAGAIAFAAAAAGAVAVDLAELKGRDCIRYCNALGGLGRALQGLADLGAGAALMALAVEMLRNPKAAYGEAEAVFMPLAKGAEGVVRETLGI